MKKSPLTDKTYTSPNRTSPRNKAVDIIVPHCFVGQASVEDAASWFMQVSAQCSCNYIIGFDGRVGDICPEKDRSWCTSSGEVDHRAITIECASGKTYPYSLNDVVWKKLIMLCLDICERYGKKKLLYLGTKDKTMSYVPKSDEMLLAEHRWFANKECPGEYIHSRLGILATEVTKLLRGDASGQPEVVVPKSEPEWFRVRLAWNNPASQIGAYEKVINARNNCPPGYSVYDYMGNLVYTNEVEGTQASLFEKMSDSEVASKLLEIATPIVKKFGLLPSVIVGQCCIETGYLHHSKLLPYNNILGMKSSLLNTSWFGSTWDGTSSVEIVTTEFINGVEKEKKDKFRVYPNIEACIEDICAFFSTLPKYVDAGILKAKDASEQITIESKCGYATDPGYISKVLNIISKNNLTVNDENRKPSANKKVHYVVQIGYFSKLKGASDRTKIYAANGIKCSIEPKNNGYRLQAGCYEIKANALNCKKEVKPKIQTLVTNGIIKKMPKIFIYEV